MKHFVKVFTSNSPHFGNSTTSRVVGFLLNRDGLSFLLNRGSLVHLPSRRIKRKEILLMP
ncbi:hypothetical protein BY996DRAFT_7532307 [Phakopsora pachyrhizi]|nr:hypothetical protein BY996DRAFT_7532307 [Phakopsora pachyrhizi]